MRRTLVLALLLASPAAAQPGDMQPIGRFAIDRTEVTVAAFRTFADATGTLTKAEREGGGTVFDSGWTTKPGWTWRTPFGLQAADDEPAVHITFPEAQAFCRWAGKRLPTDAEWLEAAHTERRPAPPPPFTAGRTYPYPTGDSPAGANCLAECGPTPAIDHRPRLTRGTGHAPTGKTPPGVNGLFDMGANAWEWTDGGTQAARPTRGGSWWYGAAQMHRDHTATKPPDTAVVYIGFRCAMDLP